MRTTTASPAGNVAVCTLFEGDYHHGVASLANSLHAQGFRGRFFAGYRGALPAWAAAATAAPAGQFRDARLLHVEGLQLIFLPLETRSHFTNYKPNLMRSLLEDAELGITGLFYLDPDITLVRPWRLFEEWLTCGIALCEDINSPLGLDHPRRVGWRRFYSQVGIELVPRTPEYVNGGCVGIDSVRLPFLETWIAISDEMAKFVGGSDATEIGGGAALARKGFFDCFDRTDQDGLNAALEASPDVPIAVLPRAAMAFSGGDIYLPHALGTNKPWRRRYLGDSLRGLAPGTADKAFWDNARGPVMSMPESRIAKLRVQLRIASAIARLYRRI
jgi:hypothetical protein